MQRLETFNRLVKLSFPESVSHQQRLGLMLSVFWERLRYDTELQDYFQYEFYKMKSSERRKYMTFSKLRKTIKICNDPSQREMYDDKTLFNKTFKDFIRRDWLDVTTTSFQEFNDFIHEHPVFFMKARVGMFGKSAGKREIMDPDDTESVQKIYDDLKKDGCIIEQLISQHSSLVQFNGSSANTLRVVTLLCADGTPKVMAGVLRIGRAGKTADNFHHHGIAATIDVPTGIVNSPGIDREFKRYIVHPDSNKQIVGFNIPSWNKVVVLVKQAALLNKFVRYVGWDVAIDDRGEVQLIEGNYGADPDVTQMPCRIGKWPEFASELSKIQAMS